MKKLVFCAALFAAISSTACSDDDESNLPATPANIVGTWQIVNEQGYWDDGDEKYTWSEDYPFMDGDEWFYWTYTFDEGGTGTFTCNGESSESVEFSYSISGNTLTINADPNNDYWEDVDNIYQIKSLTKSHLVLFESHNDWEELTSTYKRIK